MRRYTEVVVLFVTAAIVLWLYGTGTIEANVENLTNTIAAWCGGGAIPLILWGRR